MISLASLLQVGLQTSSVLGEDALTSGSVNDFLFVGLKLLFILAGLIYVAFAVVMIRQIFVMQKTLRTSFSAELRVLGFAHLIFAISILIVFVLIL